MAGNNPNDATIDIPLTPIPSKGQTGARKLDSSVSIPAYPQADGVEDEKAAHGMKAGRRRKINMEEARQAEDPSDGTITRMGRIYAAIMNFSVVTRYFVYVLPLATLFAIPIIIGATVAQNATIGGVRIVWFFTWIEVVWLSLWVSKIVAHFLPIIFQFLVGIVSSGTRKYALILAALEIPLSLVGWSVASLASFIPLMTRNPDQRAANDTATKSWEEVVKNILFAAFVSTLVLAGEKVLIQLISISYHREQFDMKIKESKRNIYLLGLLYDASRALFPSYCDEFTDEDFIIHDSLIGATGGSSKGKSSGTATPMRLMQNVGQNVGRVGDKITAAFGSVAQEITGKKVFNQSSAHSIVTDALEKRKSSEALARRIWMSFVVEGKDALYGEDIVEVLGAGREAEAEECFACLDRDGNGDVSLEEMVLTVTEFGRVRKSINSSMHDVDQAIDVLDNLLCVVVLILVVLIFVAFLNKGFGTTLAAGATALLSLSFVFATTCTEILGSCIFLFVKHPYDVGDRVDIDGKQLVVTRIALLFTVFSNIADHRATQVPNIVLNTIWIENITRSKAMREQMTLVADFGTTFGDIQLLRAEMQKFVQDKDNCRDFQPDVDIEVIGISQMDKLELRIEIRHKSNWSNETVRATRRSKFMCALVLALRKVPIYGPAGSAAALGDAAKPSYSVAISEEQAQANRDAYDKGLEDARMVPTSEMDTIAALTAGEDPTTAKASGNDHNSEARFVGALTARQPAMDRARVDETDIYREGSISSKRKSMDNPNERGTSPLRQPSTGHRREGRTSQDEPPLAPTAAPTFTSSSPSHAAPPAPAPTSSPYNPPPTIPTIVEPTGSPAATPPVPSSSGSRTDYYEYNEYAPPRQPSPGNPFGRQSPQQQQMQQQEDPYYQTATSTTVTPMTSPPQQSARRPAPGSSAQQQQQQQPPRGYPPRQP
ncbi:hypothetical protein FQN54_002873 [Arachnomyces sp. PD_36]|nr:hypothetical protein FQN54_002873 [Arachnomyces sp. PD_36]